MFHRSSTQKYYNSLEPQELKFIHNCKAKVFKRFILEKDVNEKGKNSAEGKNQGKRAES